MVEIIPMSEWKLKEAAPVVPTAPAVAPTVIERVIEKPVPALITPEEREEIKKIVAKSYEIAKKTGEKVYDVLKRKVEEWKKAREAKAKEKLREVVPTKEAKKEEAKVVAVPEKEYTRILEVKE
jgi:hypothetical protein